MADMNIFSLFLQASLLVKVVMLILATFSVISWAVIIQRMRILTSAKKEVEKFEKKFWSGSDLASLYKESQPRQDELEGSEHIFFSGFKEFTRLYQLKGHPQHAILDGANRAMQVSMNREVEHLDNNIPLLGTIGSISPYIGLFGTVWGIMNSFIALGAVKQATLSMVAPGIAEALIATALGLFAAIPAVVAHNRLSLRLMKIEQQYDNFVEEFMTILNRQVFPTGK